jgi:hypothetical protein
LTAGIKANVDGSAAIQVGGVDAITLTSAGAASFVTSPTSLAGNLAFTGTGNRITGDFSNATVANRVMFQTSTTNAATPLGVIPNGTGVNSSFGAFANSDPTNTSFGSFGIFGGADVRVQSAITGTGSYLPMTFFTGGSERMRVDTSGNVGIGTTSPSGRLDVQNNQNATSNFYFRNTDTTNTSSRAALNTTAGNQNITLLAINGDNTFIQRASGSLQFQNAGTTQMLLDSSGNVGIGVVPSSWDTINGPALQGYGWAIHTPANGGFNTLAITSNARNSTGSTYNYIGTAAASMYQQFNSNHIWFRAPSGTAGNAITFTQAMTLDSNGALILAGSTAQKATGTTWSNPSDVRLKDNVRDYGKGIAELMQVRVREWEYNGKGGTTEGMKGLGVIADEVMTVLPDTVENYDAKLNADDEETTAIKKFDATEITWLLVKALQELKAELDATKAEVALLKGAA